MSALDDLLAAAGIGGARAEALRDLEAGRRVSVRAELRAMLLVGALCVAAGLGATVRAYFDRLGPAAVLGGLGALFAASQAYAFRRGGPFSRGAVSSPHLLFDFVLYGGCVAWGLFAAYGEARFRLLGEAWPHHLLISAALFVALAYRFDNRLVLSLGLSALAGWLGLEGARVWDAFWDHHRSFALLFGALCGLAAWASARGDVKAHFQDVYGPFAAHFGLAALTSGVLQHGWSLHVLGLAGAAALLVQHALRSRKFAYLLAAAAYGYVGFSALLLRPVRSIGFSFLYFAVSSVAVAAGLYALSRRFKEEE